MQIPRATDTVGRTGIKSTIRRGNRSGMLADFGWLLRSNHSSRSCWLGWLHAVGRGRRGGATPPWVAFCRETNEKQAGCLQVSYLLRNSARSRQARPLLLFLQVC
jgi:hypothetical protein